LPFIHTRFQLIECWTTERWQALDKISETQEEKERRVLMILTKTHNRWVLTCKVAVLWSILLYWSPRVHDNEVSKRE
jgi:hypothetical protein